VQDSGSGVAGWTLTVDGTTLTSGAAGAGSAFTWDGSGLGTGDHSLLLSAVDALGNSDSVTITIRLEAEPPVVPPVVIVNTSRTATPTSTTQAAGGVAGGLGLTPTARPTTTGGTVTFGGVDNSGAAAPQAEGSPNLLWGAAALSLISATTAIVLNNRKKRKEEEIAEFIACQIEAAKKNIAEEQKKIVNYLSSLSGVQDTSLKMKQAGWSKKEIDKVIKTAQSKAVSKGSGNAAQGSSIDSVLDTAEDNLIKKAWLLKMGIAAATGVSVVSGLISGKEIYCNATAGTPITMVPLSLAGVLPVWGFFANKKNPGRGAILGLLICCMLLSACQGGSTVTPTITATLCTPTLDATATQTLTPTATEEVAALWAGPVENVAVEDLYTSFHIYFLRDFVQEYGPSLGNESLDYWENYWNDDFINIENNYGVNPLFLKLICLTETGCTLNPVPMGVDLGQGVGLMQMTGNGYDFLFTNMTPEDTQRYSLYTSVIDNLYNYQPVFVITNNNIPVYDFLNTNINPLYDPVNYSNLDWKIQVQNIAHVMNDGWCSSFEVAAGYCNNDGGPNLEEGPISIQEAALYIQLAEYYNTELIPNWNNLSEETQGFILAAEYFHGYYGIELEIEGLLSDLPPSGELTWDELRNALVRADLDDCQAGNSDCVVDYVNRFYCLSVNLETPNDYNNCQGVGD